MNVTFKPLGKREREWLTSQHVNVPGNRDTDKYYGRGTVVTIDGFIVLAFDREGHVIYQDGSEIIADLIRAQKRVLDALGKLNYEDRERIKRKGKPYLSLDEMLRQSQTRGGT